MGNAAILALDPTIARDLRFYAPARCTAALELPTFAAKLYEAFWRRVQRAGCGGAKSSFWVKTPRPIEEPGTLTRRSKDPRPLRLGVAVKYGRDAE